jgi:mediator of RNA polymerase II transcription subunit 7
MEMRRLTRSIVAAYLDLLEILIRCPDALADRQEKMEDLRSLFINTHHLINEYRPQQARDTLCMMLEMQKNERIEIAKRFRIQLDTARQTLRQCLDALPDQLELDNDIQINIQQCLIDEHQIKTNDVEPIMVTSNCRPQQQFVNKDRLLFDLFCSD